MITILLIGALKLAICNDIGEASYDRVVVAAAMCDLINSVAKRHRGYCDMVKIRDRYGIPFDTMTGEEIVYQVAEKMYQGNSISASDKLLGDFRKGFLSLVSLEAPVDALKLFGDENVRLSKKYINPSADRSSESSKPLSHNENNNLQSSSIKKKGLDSVFDSIDIGKGNYDGW